MNKQRKVLITTTYNEMGIIIDTKAEEVAQLGWIPTSERLPEDDVYVLATTAWDDVTIAERYNGDKWFINEGTVNATTDDITAWMPLPAPYRAEGEENR